MMKNQRKIKSRFSQNFYKWFGHSLIADDHGVPIQVYHGSSCATIEAFDPQYRGIIYFTPDLSYAQDYASRDASEGRVYSVHLRLEKPARYLDTTVLDILEKYDAMGLTQKEIIESFELGFDPYELFEDPSVIQALRESGYDGVLFFEEFQESIGVFSPSQIKAVDNNGSWSTVDPRIHY
jgi:hypothetical protein